MWASSFFRRVGLVRGFGRAVQTPAERAARWLRERMEAEMRARYGWLDAGVWADALSGAPRDNKLAARRLVDASLLGDEIA